MFWFGVPVGIGDRAKRRFQRPSSTLALLSTTRYALERRVTQSAKSLQSACKLVELFLCRLLIHGAEIVELIGVHRSAMSFQQDALHWAAFSLLSRSLPARQGILERTCLYSPLANGLLITEIVPPVN